MNAIFKHNLKQPCKNRGVSFEHTKDGVKLDGKEFVNMREAEDYLESKPRLDIEYRSMKTC